MADFYHGRVATVEIGIVIALIAAAVVALVIRRDAENPMPAARAIVGIAAGVLGALVILTTITDLIPDPWEAAVAPIGLVLITAALILLTTRRLAS